MSKIERITLGFLFCVSVVLGSFTLYVATIKGGSLFLFAIFFGSGMSAYMIMWLLRHDWDIEQKTTSKK